MLKEKMNRAHNRPSFLWTCVLSGTNKTNGTEKSYGLVFSGSICKNITR